MASTRCFKAFRRGEDDLLKFKLVIRMKKKRDLSDFERGMTAGLSILENADLEGFVHNNFYSLQRMVQGTKIQQVAFMWSKKP